VEVACNRLAIDLAACYRSATDLHSLCNRLPIALQILRNCDHCAITLKSLCYCFETDLQSLADRFAIAFLSLCNRSANVLQSLRDHFEIEF
jgi:uncharacterized protein YerC